MDKSLKIAILGTRGIPNNYGGFEACAQNLARLLTEKGHKVSVYCSHNHPYKESNWQNVQLIHQYNPEDILGTSGQFIYDFLCNIHSVRQDFDIILHLGYTSDSVWNKLWSRKSKHITNMDGMEWKRSKYSPLVKKFLKKAEYWATKKSSFLVADSPAIKKYIDEKYNTNARYIAYGSEIPISFEKKHLQNFNLIPFKYDLILARMEPENNIEMMIKAKIISKDENPLVIIGNSNKYSQYLKTKYNQNHEIIFLSAIYESDKLNSIRHFSRYYLHGHSAGGTNPSLLEAMACSCRILAHNNAYNVYVLENNSVYFSDSNDLANILKESDLELITEDLILSNLNKIKCQYNWDFITSEYEKLFYEAISK